MLDKDTNPNGQEATTEEQRAVLESIFGTPTNDAFDEDQWVDGDTPEQQPDLPKPEEAPEPKPQDNDAVRYQYWQAEADKRAVELAKTKAEVDYYKHLAELNQQVEPQEPETFAFPDPPERPKPPLGYSVEEALQNPQSPSAKFAADYQQWQEDIIEYSSLKTKYLEATMQEKFEALENEKAQMAQQRQAQEQYAQQMAAVKNEVKKFGADDKATDDFIKWSSSPESLTIDNLYKFWQFMNSGGQQQTKPTDTFNQTKNAAQFGPAFNQLPPGTPTVGKSPTDQIFDAILEGDKKRNDW